LIRRTRAGFRPAGVGCVLALGAVAVACGNTDALRAAPAPAPAPACAIHALPLPQGMDAGSVEGASPDGSALVGSARKIGTGTAVVWRSGTIADTVEHAPGALVDINGTGVGVGDAADGQKHHPWVYENGKARTLTGEGTAHAIGEDGRIVGSRLMPVPNGSPVAVPATWAPGSNTSIDLANPHKDTGEAFDVSADGTVVGSLGQDAYVWRPDGTHGPLKRPDGVPPGRGVRAVKINGPWVVGKADEFGVVRWNLDTGRVEPVPGPQGTPQADAVSAHGAVVVESSGYDAAVVADGKPTPLASLDNYRQRSLPSSINQDGHILGGTAQLAGNPSSMTEKPVYWTC
jgi:uncharacterized membrane protein